MQFQNPSILYFLVLLIIPIIVHLFQLQKFIKVSFTNVAFLQKLVQQSRKSSKLKKWLILATRMLLFTAIIFAFSQPYLSNKKTEIKQHTFVYLDNSLSTNSKGKKGNLLKIAAQEIIANANPKDSYSLHTNSTFDENITYTALKDKLLNIQNSSKKVDINSIFLKINSVQKNKTNTLSKNILISDFQNYKYDKFTNVTSNFSGVQLKQAQKNNISIDSVFTNNTITDNLIINVIVKNQGEAKTNIPVAVFNKGKLISKQSFSIAENAKQTVSFTIQKESNFLGKINIAFSDTFSFDNQFYFSLNATKKINVLSIGKAANFLSKIYTEKEFNLTQNTLQNLNYNAISKQQIIVLNELEKIPEILSKSILNFTNKGGTVVVIPNQKINLISYNSFLQKIAKARINSINRDTLKITNINFNHPVFKNVFSKKVKNFQYPIVKSNYPILASNLSNIINFENNAPFTAQLKTKSGNLFWISSALSKENSNFLNSPLIVPLFYNFGKLSFQNSKLYYYLDDENKIDIETSLNKDEILTLASKNSSFIPPQQTYQHKVSISTKSNPSTSGFYHILSKKDTIQTIAFNSPKAESNLNFLDISKINSETGKNINFSSSISEVFEDLNKKNEVQWLWKWFLALAIVSLFLEILILKFYKP